jgi:hypothetical protein
MARTSAKDRQPNPLADLATYVGLVIQVLLGILSAHLLAVTTAFQAVAVGYAAPDLLTRLLGNIAGQQAPRAAVAPAGGRPIGRLVAWWRD